MPETPVPRAGPPGAAIQSVARACALLEQLALLPATVHRLLRALCAAGLVTQDATTRLYHPTLRLFEWGQAAVLRLQVREVAKPFLQSLAAEVKETATLGLREGADVIYIEWIPGHHLIQPRVHIGARVPAYRSSLGQCLLAWLPDDERRRLLHSRPLVRGGPNTLLSVAAIEQRLTEVRARGYAIDDEEHAAGARAVGAPLRDAAGRVVAAIGLVAPTSRMPPRRIAALGQRLIEVAHTISSHLGYSAGATPLSTAR